MRLTPDSMSTLRWASKVTKARRLIRLTSQARLSAKFSLNQSHDQPTKSTIPLLLGAPIPFNSLGTPITDFFAGKTSEYQILSEAYRQIVHYLNEYAKNSPGGAKTFDQLTPTIELNTTDDVRG